MPNDLDVAAPRSIVSNQSPLVCREGDMVDMALHRQKVVEGFLLQVDVQVSHYHHMGALVIQEYGIQLLRQEVQRGGSLPGERYMAHRRRPLLSASTSLKKNAPVRRGNTTSSSCVWRPSLEQVATPPILFSWSFLTHWE